tara:strand:+ start:93 stop:686 length:594 start_codon:yes stop_codon:yes gene_type:complete
MDWGPDIETLLCTAADQAQVRESLHRKSYYRYKKLTHCFSLPIIVLSALSGSLQFLSKGVDKELEQRIVTCTASLSILTAVISSVSSYLKLGEQMSRHEAAANQWLLFYSELQYTLSLAREKRCPAEEFLNQVKTTTDRLFEISPICSASMIARLKKKIRANAHEDFVVPPALNGWAHMRAFVEGNEQDFEDNSEQD